MNIQEAGMNKEIQTKKGPVKAGQIARMLLFLLVVAIFYQIVTYVQDQEVTKSVAVFRALPEDTIDAAMIGSSNVYRFFDPMVGWDKYGMTTYVYSVEGMHGENVIFALKDILRTQKPRLVVIEARSFVSTKIGNSLSKALYRFEKNFKNPLTRWEIIYHFCKLNGIPFSSQAREYYFPLTMNHGNYWKLMRIGEWKRALGISKRDIGTKRGPFMGYRMSQNWKPLAPSEYDSKLRLPLSRGHEKALREVLDFCAKRDINVILASSPFRYTDDDAGELNTIKDIAQEYDIPFLNANIDREKIGIDYSTDFYNNNHTNVLGAEKYTNYIFDYLDENYDFSDHRGQEGYGYWDEITGDYRAMLARYKDGVREKIAAGETQDPGTGI